MNNKRKAPAVSYQGQKKIKHNKDIQIPNFIQIPQGFKGPIDTKVIRNSSSDLQNKSIPLQPQSQQNQRKDIQRPQSQLSQQSSRSKPPNLDINSKLHKFNLPSQYKEVLGDDLEQLKQFARRKEKKEKAIQDLIKQGKVKQQQLQQIQIIKKPKENVSQDKMDGEKIQMTEDGKLRDVSGGILKIREHTNQLKVNQQKKKEQKLKDVLRKQKQLKEAINERGKYYDRNLSASLFGNTGKRQKKKILALNFIEKGSISVNIDLRQKQEDLESKLSSAIGIDIEKNENDVQGEIQEAKIPTFQSNGFKRVAVRMKHYDPIPNIEWWDQDMLPSQQGNYIPLNAVDNKGSLVKQPTTAHTKEEIEENLSFLKDYQFFDKDLRLEKITIYVEHPEPFKVSDIVQSRERAAIPVYLTKQEKKRLTRRKRAEVEKDKQDRVRLGLQQPDPPKIKLSNMMRILGTEAIIDPSKAEKEVKRQMQERYDKHTKDNESRKLSKDQKGEKLRKKWERDAAQEVRMAVFRIEDMTDPSVKFKVNMNAQQVGLQGLSLACNSLMQEALGQTIPSLVVAEGGPKGIKFYKKLLLNRIKWDLKPELNKTVGCTLIWEGVQKQHNFNRWRTVEMKSEADGRLALAEKNLEHFWDLAMKQPQNT